MHELLERLRGADRDSKGGSERAAAAAVADPPLIAVLLDGMRCGDEIVRLRAADAAEKAARERPELVAPHADALIDVAGSAREPEIRWHAAQMLARVELSDERAVEATRILEAYLDDASPKVRGWALSALVAIANHHADLRGAARDHVIGCTESGDAGLAARARLLLSQADSWPSA